MLKPLKIGNLDVKNPVVLAPQAGITDFSFRKLVSSFGGPEYSTSLTVEEMIASTAQIYNKNLCIPYKKLSSLLSVQIFGNDPAVMAESATINQELGADIIDINMGCPVKKIVNNKSGAYLMKDIELAQRIVKKVVDAVNIPVSVKIRSGWDNGSVNAVDFVNMLENCGVSFITIHGRTRSQQFSGVVDKSIIKQVKESIKIPVVANGDIYNETDAKNMFLDTNCDGIMIGRGIYGKPWLLQYIIYYLKTGKMLPDKNVIEIRNILLKFLQDLVNEEGEKTGLLKARKHILWYSKGIKNSTEFRQKITRVNNLDEVNNLINQFFI